MHYLLYFKGRNKETEDRQQTQDSRLKTGDSKQQTGNGGQQGGNKIKRAVEKTNVWEVWKHK